MKRLILILFGISVCFWCKADGWQSFKELPYSMQRHFTQLNVMEASNPLFKSYMIVDDGLLLVDMGKVAPPIGMLQPTMDGVYNKPSIVARMMSMCYQREAKRYSSLRKKDVKRVSIFWVHIEGDEHIPVTLWNLCHSEEESFPEPFFFLLNNQCLIGKFYYEGAYCFAYTCDGCLGLWFFKNEDALLEKVLPGITSLRNAMDTGIVKQWYDMLPVRDLQDTFLEAPIIMPVIKGGGFKSLEAYRKDFWSQLEELMDKDKQKEH